MAGFERLLQLYPQIDGTISQLLLGTIVTCLAVLSVGKSLDKIFSARRKRRIAYFVRFMIGIRRNNLSNHQLNSVSNFIYGWPLLLIVAQISITVQIISEIKSFGGKFQLVQVFLFLIVTLLGLIIAKKMREITVESRSIFVFFIGNISVFTFMCMIIAIIFTPLSFFSINSQTPREPRIVDLAFFAHSMSEQGVTIHLLTFLSLNNDNGNYIVDPVPIGSIEVKQPPKCFQEISDYLQTELAGRFLEKLPADYSLTSNERFECSFITSQLSNKAYAVKFKFPTNFGIFSVLFGLSGPNIIGTGVKAQAGIQVSVQHQASQIKGEKSSPLYDAYIIRQMMRSDQRGDYKKIDDIFMKLSLLPSVNILVTFILVMSIQIILSLIILLLQSFEDMITQEIDNPIKRKMAISLDVNPATIISLFVCDIMISVIGSCALLLAIFSTFPNI